MDSATNDPAVGQPSKDTGGLRAPSASLSPPPITALLEGIMPEEQEKTLARRRSQCVSQGLPYRVIRLRAIREA